MTRSSDPNDGAPATPRPSPGPSPVDARSCDDHPGPTDTLTLVVHVVRTGGVAGLRREWTAEPAADEASVWIPLIEECPWDDATGHSPGADRFVWRISARRDREPERSARLGDSEVTGPWRALVDAVREYRR